MFKTWALIVMITTANGDEPQYKARFSSLEDCMLAAELVVSTSVDKRNSSFLYNKGYCFRSSSGEMYRVRDYIRNRYFECQRLELCEKPVPKKPVTMAPESTQSLSKKPSFVFAK